jgi:hypothetical protein
VTDVTLAQVLERLIALERRVGDSVEPTVNEHEDRLDAHDQQLGEVSASVDALKGEVTNLRTVTNLGNVATHKKLDALMDYWGVPRG